MKLAILSWNLLKFLGVIFTYRKLEHSILPFLLLQYLQQMGRPDVHHRENEQVALDKRTGQWLTAAGMQARTSSTLAG